MIGRSGRYWFTPPELGFYLSAWSLFHFLEFAVTAHWNRPRVTVDCPPLPPLFLFHADGFGVGSVPDQQWHTLPYSARVRDSGVSGVDVFRAVGEAVLPPLTLWCAPHTRFLLPGTDEVIGMVMTIAAQALRSAAMMHASTSFTHNVVTYRRAASHKLITTGVYAYMRHPSYAAFLYWALGTQIALLNPVSFLGFWFVLRRFFTARTRGMWFCVVHVRGG